MRYLEEFQNAQTVNSSRHMPEQPKWTAPSQGIIKVNFDGVVNVSKVVSGMKVMARDSMNTVVGVLQSVIKDIVDPTTVEIVWLLLKL